MNIISKVKQADILILDPEYELSDTDSSIRIASTENDIHKEFDVFFQKVRSRNNEYKTLLENELPPNTYNPLILCINNLRKLKEVLDDERINDLDVILNKSETYYQISIIITGDETTLNPLLYEDWFMLHVSKRNIIWLGKDFKRNCLFKSKNNINDNITDEFGIAMTNGNAEVIKYDSSKNGSSEGKA